MYRTAHAGITVDTNVILEIYPDDNPWNPTQGFSIIIPTGILSTVITAITNEVQYIYSDDNLHITIDEMVTFTSGIHRKSIYAEVVQHLFMYAHGKIQLPEV